MSPLNHYRDNEHPVDIMADSTEPDQFGNLVDQNQQIDLDNLARQIRTMSTRSGLYRTIKRELSLRGWWKNRPRGKPGIF